MPELPSVDELFKLSTSNGKVETVVKIPLKEISNFPNHPFKIRDDEEMELMVESIKNGGIRQPVIVRRKEDGSYEMISGHRRKHASELAGIKEIPAIVKEMSDDEATIFMVDSNIQREKILPSEKAFAYKMKLDAIKNQGKRNDLTSAQLVQKLDNKTAREKIGEEFGESRETIRRYIRLTELDENILNLVDEGKIAFSPAVEISYLDKEEQNVLLECMKQYQATPSQSQAIYLKKLSQEGNLTTDKIEEVMEQEKPNQIPKYNINYTRFEKFLPRDVVTPKEVEDFLFNCVEEHYNRQKARQMAR